MRREEATRRSGIDGGSSAGHECPGYELRRMNPASPGSNKVPVFQTGFIRRNA
jgi:hypothetical protein